MTKSGLLNGLFFKRFAVLCRMAMPGASDIFLFLVAPCTVAAYIAVGFVVALVPGRMFKALLADDYGAFRSEPNRKMVVIAQLLVLPKVPGT